MTQQRDLKSLIRERMEKTGERYAAARRNLLGTEGSLDGWARAGSAPKDYEFATERGPVAVIRARVDAPAGFGTLMQELVAQEYCAKRVQLRATLRSERVSGWCGLWMRIDGATERAIAFDSMQSRPIRGSTDWTRHDVVLDVAPAAARLAFGVLLDGAGAVWLREVSLEIVGDDVPVTAPRKPQNLSFQK